MKRNSLKSDWMGNDKRVPSDKLKIVIALAAVAMMVSCSLVMLCDTDSDAVDSCGDGLGYTYDDINKTLTIEKVSNGTGAMEDFSGSTPYWQGEDIRHIILGSGVTVITTNAFNGLADLESVVFSDTLTEIHDYAFHSISFGMFNGLSGDDLNDIKGKKFVLEPSYGVPIRENEIPLIIHIEQNQGNASVKAGGKTVWSITYTASGVQIKPWYNYNNGGEGYYVTSAPQGTVITVEGSKHGYAFGSSAEDPSTSEVKEITNEGFQLNSATIVDFGFDPVEYNLTIEKDGNKRTLSYNVENFDALLSEIPADKLDRLRYDGTTGKYYIGTREVDLMNSTVFDGLTIIIREMEETDGITTSYDTYSTYVIRGNNAFEYMNLYENGSLLDADLYTRATSTLINASVSRFINDPFPEITDPLKVTTDMGKSTIDSARFGAIECSLIRETVEDGYGVSITYDTYIYNNKIVKRIDTIDYGGGSMAVRTKEYAANEKIDTELFGNVECEVLIDTTVYGSFVTTEKQYLCNGLTVMSHATQDDGDPATENHVTIEVLGGIFHLPFITHEGYAMNLDAANTPEDNTAPPAPTDDPADNPDGPSNGGNKGLLIGGIVAGVIGVAAVAGAVIFIMKKR